MAKSNKPVVVIRFTNPDKIAIDRLASEKDMPVATLCRSIILDYLTERVRVEQERKK